MENGGDKKLLIITSKAVAENVVHSMQENNYARYSLAGVVVIDEDCTGEKICGVPVVAGESDVPMYVCQEWIDEVLIVISENLPYPDGLIDKLTETGVTVHLNLAKITNQTGKRQFVEKVGSYTVLTTSLNYASFGQLFLKRLMDICGGLVGCIFTGIITIFVGPPSTWHPRARFSSPRNVWERTERNSKCTNSAACTWMRKRGKPSL
ncbi:MAG: nucleoside-diphosphate sugar epimerase/dehydratase [Ruminococcus sp.]